MWLSLVIALVQLFGAIFGPWIRKRLGLAAEGMVGTLAERDPRDAVSELFDRAIDATPFWNIGQRFALRIMKSLALVHAEDLHKAAMSGVESPVVEPLTEVEMRHARAAADGMGDAAQVGG